jgi:threonine aldolase
MIVDLRSDTVTKPTRGMQEAMMGAKVGDDVFGEDPSVKELEEKCASMLGMAAGIYCPSGTMTNQIGIKILTQPYDEVICYKGSHIYKYEGGGVAGNSLASMRLLEGNRGRLSVEEIAANINNIQDVHQPISSVVSLENTVVREAGSYYYLKDITTISDFARSKGLKMHLDGARFFNALAETGDKAIDYGEHFDSISICLSKGLGAPVGSVLVVGNKELEIKARRMRKVFGGGMRQAGFIAAAGSYALDHHVRRLKEDHVRAAELGKVLGSVNWVKSMMPVDTNIVIFSVIENISPENVLAKLADHDIKAIKFGAQEIRLVTHLDVDDRMLDKAVEVIKKISF